ncbi:MAG: hypothetical protein ACXVX8_10890 [Blastococcus sp.]
MRTGRTDTGHHGRLTSGIRSAGRGTLGWLRRGQLGSADVQAIHSHPAGQWRF